MTGIAKHRQGYKAPGLERNHEQQQDMTVADMEERADCDVDTGLPAPVVAVAVIAPADDVQRELVSEAGALKRGD